MASGEAQAGARFLAALLLLAAGLQTGLCTPTAAPTTACCVGLWVPRCGPPRAMLYTCWRLTSDRGETPFRCSSERDASGGCPEGFEACTWEAGPGKLFVGEPMLRTQTIVLSFRFRVHLRVRVDSSGAIMLSTAPSSRTLTCARSRSGRRFVQAAPRTRRRAGAGIGIFHRLTPPVITRSYGRSS